MNIYFLYFFCVFMPLLSFSNPSPEIKVQQIDDGVYLYRSFAEYKGQQVSANGLILESADEVVLIDTPWDKQQTIQLLNWIDQEIHKPISYAVITHAHMDRIGGIDVLRSHNIPSISGRLTVKEATQNGHISPGKSFRTDTLLTYGNSSLEAYYPGPGHMLF